MLLSLDTGTHPVRYLAGLPYTSAPAAGPRCLDLFLPQRPHADHADHADHRPAPAPAPAPAVVYFHGGGWQHGDRSAGLAPWLSPLLAAHGFVAASAGYRLTDRAPFPAQLDDARAAVAWLRDHAAEYGIDPDRIGAWGDSAGGHLAALLGARGDVRAVVARCAPTDFTSPDAWPADPEGDAIRARLFGGPADGTTLALRRRASPVHQVRAGAARFLLVHGERDEVVPHRHAERLAAALAAHGVPATLHTVPGGHHNLLPDIDAPWGNDPWEALGDRALDFFRHHLAAPPA